MTKNEITAFLASINDRLIIRVYLKNRKMLLTHFFEKNQKKEMMEQNKWIMFVLTANENKLILGDDIIKLKPGANPSDN
jgi:hypothetical protein